MKLPSHNGYMYVTPKQLKHLQKGHTVFIRRDKKYIKLAVYTDDSKIKNLDAQIRLLRAKRKVLLEKTSHGNVQETLHTVS